MHGLLVAKAELVLFAGILHLINSGYRLNVPCRAPIDISQLQRFTLQEDRPPPQKPVLNNGELVPVSQRQIQYNMISEFKFLRRCEPTFINRRERSHFICRYPDDGIEWKLWKQDSDARSTSSAHPTCRPWRQEYRFFCMG